MVLLENSYFKERRLDKYISWTKRQSSLKKRKKKSDQILFVWFNQYKNIISQTNKHPNNLITKTTQTKNKQEQKINDKMKLEMNQMTWSKHKLMHVWNDYYISMYINLVPSFTVRVVINIKKMFIVIIIAGIGWLNW